MNTRSIVFGRHAKSSWTDPGQLDIDRPLNERGFRDAPVMAGRLHLLGLTLDAVLSSSATRAIQTAQAFAATGQLEVIQIPALYHADADAYLEALRVLPDKVVNVAIFGHNPTMTLIAHLIRAGQVGHVPTCGLLIADCTIETWEDLRWENLQFRSFLAPKDGV